jgi:periplasmic divalent cation tolerance protein
MHNEPIQVQTATATKADAELIAAALVERRLAACVQVLGPIISTYRWQAAVAHADEWLCLIKTERRLFDRVEEAIRELHPYETPEIIATAIVAGSADYLAWISDSVDNRA